MACICLPPPSLPLTPYFTVQTIASPSPLKPCPSPLSRTMKVMSKGQWPGYCCTPWCDHCFGPDCWQLPSSCRLQKDLDINTTHLLQPRAGSLLCRQVSGKTLHLFCRLWTRLLFKVDSFSPWAKPGHSVFERWDKATRAYSLVSTVLPRVPTKARDLRHMIPRQDSPGIPSIWQKQMVDIFASCFLSHNNGKHI